MTLTDYIQRLRGSSVNADLSRFRAELAAIAAIERETNDVKSEELGARAATLTGRARAGEAPASLRPAVYALARQAARRTIGLHPFDEQVLAALALDNGAVVEMQTGEGKTLAAVMPVALNALTGRGVHVLTFNDYLARRDAEWMGPVYRALGLSVAFVEHGMPAEARRAAYAADITYVTAKEAGFDRLRDLLALTRDEVVHRPFHFALVDEADSLMIDEARVPLVIAGATGGVESMAPALEAVVRSLSPGIHFDSDEYGRDIELTEAGIEHVERVLGRGSLHAPANLALLTELNCALHARALLRRDRDYIVRDGRIEIVDEFTGRVVTDRHWPDGLQAALEAKEGLVRRDDGRILGSITLQRFLRGYPRLCGMTGTARTAAEELKQVYGLDVTVIPTHRPARRVDRPDAIFATLAAKERAIVNEIRVAHSTGRPVLVGTASVTESERLAQQLLAAGLPCVVLNAKNDEEEASIVARAGERGAITISTNMAGRGTDIRLGGADEAEREAIAALGGLYVIGANRHESERVDLQLRGRAGRQGDPGESRFFVSLEDELLVRFGIRSLIAGRYEHHDPDVPIDNAIVRREVARAQRIVDGQNYEIRKTLARYTAVVEEQHQRVIEQRTNLLNGDEIPDTWSRDPARRSSLVASAGEDAVGDAERLVTLACMDRMWRDHLAFCADVREGIHLVRLGNSDPLTAFTSQVIHAFEGFDDAVDSAVLTALSCVRADGGTLDLTATGLKAPSSTWTYLVNDDPFRNRIGAMLTGPGGPTLAIYAAAILMPLFVLWGLVDRLLGRRSTRRPRPFE